MFKGHKHIVRRVNEAFASNNLEGFLEHCTDDVSFGMVGDRTVKGKEAVRQFMKSMDGGDAPQINAGDIIAEGDRVAALGTMTMQDKDGTMQSYTYCDVYRFRDDKKISELQAFVMKSEKK